MATYVSKVSVDDALPIPVGSSLYGVCTSAIDATTKVVTLANFDSLQNGVTVHVKFTNGNSAPLNSSFKLQVGSTPAQFIKNPGGSVAWSSGAVVSFTYDSSDHSWIANDSTAANVAILNTYDPTSEQGISGVGVADALSNLGNAATKRYAVYIGNGNQNSDDYLPTIYAVTRYIDSKIASGGGGSSTGEGPDPDALHYLGVTSSNITKTPSINPIMIDDTPVEPEINDLVRTSDNKLYVWIGTWSLFVDEDSFGIRVYRQTEGYNQDLPLLVSRSDASSIGVANTDDSYTNNIYGVVWDDSTKTPTVNINTGVLKAKTFSGSGASLTNLDAESLSTGTVPLARLADSGVDAGTYGPDTNVNADYGDTFEVPQVIVDAKGRVTFATERTISLPPSDNTDANVLQQESNDEQEYSILLKYSTNFTTETNGTRFATESKKVTINPALGRITATGGFVGVVSNATTAQVALSIEWANILNRPSLSIAGIPFGLNDTANHTISAVDLRIALGLQNALHFIGVMSRNNGGEIVLPENYTPQSGDVIIVEGFEYIYAEINPTTHTGAWEKFGDDSSFKLKQQAIIDDPDHTNQNAITFVSHIGQNEHGVINVTKSYLPFAAADMFGIVSLEDQSFSGLKHFLNGIEIKTTANSVNKITINGTTIKASGATDANGVLNIQPNGGTIFIGEDSPAFLIMTGNSQFIGNVGIGTAPESATSGHIHKLKINGSTLIMSGNTSIAHLDIGTKSNREILQFYPHTGDTGSLGTLENRWESLFLSSELLIGNSSDDGFTATAAGIITIRGTTPTINLINGINSQWTISTSGALINITNGFNGIQGNAYGFKITNCLFINEDIPANIALLDRALYVNGNSIFTGFAFIQDQTESAALNNGALIVNGGAGFAKNVNIGGKVGIGTTIDTNTNDPHQLTVQGSILIKLKDANNAVHNVAHLDANALTYDNNYYGQLVFYPEEPDVGYIGTINNKWYSGYFNNSVNVAATNLIGVHVNGTGNIELYANNTYVQFTDGTINWQIGDNTRVFYISSLDDNNTFIKGYNTNGFIISPRIAIGGALISAYALTVYGTEYVNTSMGIGALPQEDVTLTVQDYIKLVHNNNDIAHLEYVDYGNASILAFYPEAAEAGSIGTADHRWKSLYLSNDFNITNLNDNSIGFYAETGVISISAVIPTILLNTLDVEQSNWRIINDEGVFTITDLHDVFIRGLSNLGFAIYPRLYISDTVDNAAAYNLYVAGEENEIGNIQLYGYTGIGTFSDYDRTQLEDERAMLVVQNAMKFAHDGSSASLIDVGYIGYRLTEVDNNLIESFEVYTKDRIGFLGKADRRWKRLYLYEGIEINDEFNNNGTDYITLSTTLATGSNFILSSDLNNCMIAMSTQENSDALITVTSVGTGNSSVLSFNAETVRIEMNTSEDDTTANWIITNTGVISLSNGNITFSGNNYGFELNEHLYVNSAVGEDPTYVLLVNDPEGSNAIGLSKISGTLGIGAEPNGAYLAVQDYFKLVHEAQGQDNPDLTHLTYTRNGVLFYPERNATDYIGLESNRWKHLFLSHTINIKQTVSGTDQSIVLDAFGAQMILTAPTPAIQFVSTTGSAPTWTISNIGSARELMIQDTLDTTHIRIVNHYGVEIQRSLCIRDPRVQNPVSIEATSAYALYIDGDIHTSGGFNTSNNIFPTTHETQNNGRPDEMWRAFYSISFSTRYITAAPQNHRPSIGTEYITDTTDGALYLGYYHERFSGTHAIYPTRMIRLFTSDGISASVEHLRVESTGVYVPTSLILGPAIANANYKLIVGGAAQFLGSIVVGGHTQFLSIGPTYDIGSYDVLGAEPVSNMLRTLYTESVSVKYIDAAPEDQNSSHEIIIGYFNIAESEQHAVTPTEAIRFFSSDPDLTVPTIPVEQMQINANGTFIYNNLIMGDTTDLDKSINYLTTDTAITFLNNDAYRYTAGHAMAITAVGTLFIGSGDTVIENRDELSVLSNSDSVKQNIFIVADGGILVAANTQGHMNERNGFAVYGDTVLPYYHGVVSSPIATSNTDDQSGTSSQVLMGMSLGAATARWLSLHVGLSSTYGGPRKLFWWNNGIPEDSQVTMDPTKPVYLLNGEISETGYTLASHVMALQPVIEYPADENDPPIYHYDQHKLAYYSFAGEYHVSQITPASISTDGGYLEDVTHLFITGGAPNIYGYTDQTCTLAVQGKTFLTDDVNFATFTPNQQLVPRIIWNCDGNIVGDTTVQYESAALIYYKVTASSPTQVTDELHIDINYTESGNVVFGTTLGGSVYVNPHTGNVYPRATTPGTLGLTTNRWSKLYVGTADTYGDEYTPVYWNNGVPAAVAPVTYTSFQINNGKTGVRLSHSAFTAKSYVLQIVVTQGEANLNGLIEWTSSNENYIELTTTAAVSGAVKGYIIVARGEVITATATNIPEDIPEPEEPEEPSDPNEPNDPNSNESDDSEDPGSSEGPGE